MRLGSCHTLFIVGVGCFHSLGIEVEVLRIDRWSKGTHRLAGRTPQAWHHVEGKSQRQQSPHDAWYRHRTGDVTACLVTAELEPTHKIGPKGNEDDYPKREKSFTVEDVPPVCKVSHGEELERKGQFYET